MFPNTNQQQQRFEIGNKPNIFTLTNFTTESGAFYATLNLSYQVFDLLCTMAPIVL